MQGMFGWQVGVNSVKITFRKHTSIHIYIYLLKNWNGCMCKYIHIHKYIYIYIHACVLIGCICN